MKARFVYLYCGAILLTSVGLAGCGFSPSRPVGSPVADSSILGNTFKVNRQGEWRMSRQAGVFLAWPQADTGGRSSWPRTRLYLAERLADQAGQRFQRVIPGTVDDASADLADLAVAAGADFILKLRVHQVDAPSAFPDVPAVRVDSAADTDIRHKKLRMSLQVYESNTGRLLDTVSISARRPWYMSDLALGNPLADEAITLMLDQLIH